MKIVIIDNYDSFTYNLSHMVKALGADVTVYRNDQFEMSQLEQFDKIILSPGPGIPSEAGLLLDVIREYAGRKPILGVCLGHQAIGEFFGGKLENLSNVFHGIATEGTILPHAGYIPEAHSSLDTDRVMTSLFVGLPSRISMGRYHSWVVSRESLPDCLEITAVSDEGQIMALRHKTLDVQGIQFHPESILTPEGKTIIQNWLYA